MNRDLETAGRSLDEELGSPPTLRDAEQDALAVRAEGEETVEAAGGEEVGDGTEPVLV